MSHGTRRVAGLIVLFLGAAVLIDTTRSLASDVLSTKQVAWLTALVLPVCSLGMLFGWRLALNRPNAYGSIMSPTGWRICATLMLLVAGGVAALQLKLGLGVSWALLSPVALAIACAARAEGLVRRGAITSDRVPRSGP